MEEEASPFSAKIARTSLIRRVKLHNRNCHAPTRKVEYG
ncbi:hypothetical protein CCACVL1_18089 [Corchorus capsularis]|uniref:Uncharacterized protein n=1 Tax=Corchorus capsularis TaxID=210143 RepID=A0A1R3HMR6_COCAP|nr:hypothetical protein CCACVL1_18089 [Corchorus capsularis]